MDGLDRLCILSVEGTQSVRTVVPVGQRAPLYAGSDGRVLLAFQEPQFIQDFIHSCGLVPNTQNTITNHETLLEVLSRVREEGSAISRGEWVPGSVGISAPIRDATGNVIAAVSMSVPDYRATASIVTTYKLAVMDAANKISSLLGFVP